MQEMWEEFYVQETEEEAIQSPVSIGGNTAACRGAAKLPRIGEAISGDNWGEGQCGDIAEDGGGDGESVQDASRDVARSGIE